MTHEEENEANRDLVDQLSSILWMNGPDTEWNSDTFDHIMLAFTTWRPDLIPSYTTD